LVTPHDQHQRLLLVLLMWRRRVLGLSCIGCH
jgi:hypothetical protein